MLRMCKVHRQAMRDRLIFLQAVEYEAVVNDLRLTLILKSCYYGRSLLLQFHKHYYVYGPYEINSVQPPDMTLENTVKLKWSS